MELDPLLPDARFTLLPRAVAAIYLFTVLAILIDTRRLRSPIAGLNSLPLPHGHGMGLGPRVKRAA
jgi:hypothetical protein